VHQVAFHWQPLDRSSYQVPRRADFTRIAIAQRGSLLNHLIGTRKQGERGS
jgi:hypothetical protein